MFTGLYVCVFVKRKKTRSVIAFTSNVRAQHFNGPNTFTTKNPMLRTNCSNTATLPEHADNKVFNLASMIFMGLKIRSLIKCLGTTFPIQRVLSVCCSGGILSNWNITMFFFNSKPHSFWQEFFGLKYVRPVNERNRDRYSSSIIGPLLCQLTLGDSQRTHITINTKSSRTWSWLVIVSMDKLPTICK